MAAFDKNTRVASFHHIFIHLHFFLFLLISITQFPFASHCCHEEERSALLSFKSSLDDYSNRLSSWQQGKKHENCCNWHGIRCSNETLRVVSVDLRNKDLENYYNKKMVPYNVGSSDTPSTSLTGIFSASLLKLTHLEYLDLSYNDFQESQIPRQFSDLTSLTHLDLSFSVFSSSISTQFTNISSLQFLDLSCTSENYYLSSSCLQISSTKWLGGLVNLKVLRLSGIDLYEAASSPEKFGEHISYLSNLMDLDLSYCGISSLVFPIHKFHNLSRLSSLKMNRNSQLNSLFPVQLAKLASLSILELSYCNLHGSVPYLPQIKELDVSGNEGLHVDITRMFKHQWPKLRKLWISSTVVNKSITSSISNAPLLFSLDASSCSIQGSLPSSFYNLSQLQYLDLSGNWITGIIHPLISNLKSLYHLGLASNSIEGIIPKSICENSLLQVLSLSFNNITGTIPSCISKLQNLREFRVAGNSIKGNVSLFSLISENLISLDMRSNRQLNLDMRSNLDQYSLHPMFSLKNLMLSSCNLQGLFPVSICNFTNLVELDLAKNSLTGTIPSCFSKFKYLRQIYLMENKLRGPLPLPPHSIMEFDISSNKFSGVISLELGRILSQATIIGLSGNELSGSIPFTLCPTEPGFPDITYIDLSNNKLSGKIPSNIGYCGYLATLMLGNNNLTGKVPDALKLAEYLKFLQLNNNHLDGAPLKIISEFHGLEFLNLAYNNFEGSIPATLGSLQILRFLSLRSNKFNGSIPEEITHLQHLQLLDLSLNNFSGNIPNGLGNLSGFIATNELEFRYFGDAQLELATKGITTQIKELHDYTSAIDLSCNYLHGNIPKEIGLLTLLYSLNLSHNHFSNDIPESIGNLSGLQSLDLSSNYLSGHIPQSLAMIDTLAVLNISSNKLRGKIPRGPHFDTVSIDGSAFSENELLCGYPTNKLCDEDRNTRTNDANPAIEFDEVDREDAKEKLLLYAIVALGFIVGFWGLFFVLFQKRHQWWFPYWKMVDSVAVRIVVYIQK
ncbi:hypothetical protein MKW92_012524 [Papaver armeniacum]|nr:hypothetical protein MKW92_012524 [Papaver armeniacum]